MIPHILHHANRSCKSPEFYEIKNKLLQNAEVVGYDIQHIEGKKCFACDGTGVYHKLDQYRIWNSESCYRCTSGWYKQPMWVFLAVKQFGPYRFHQPMHRRYGEKNPYHLPSGLRASTIEGYVQHDYSRYGYLAVLILFIIYNRPAAKRYFREMGFGFRTRWWMPMNWLYVIAHFYYHRTDAYPIRNLKSWWVDVQHRYAVGVEKRNEVMDDLPF